MVKRQDKVDKAMDGTNQVLLDQVESIIAQLRAEEQGADMFGDDDMNPMDKEQMPGAMMGEGDRMEQGDYRKEDDDDYDEMGDMTGKRRAMMKAEETDETAREDAESRTEEEQPDGSDEAMRLVDKRLAQMERSIAAMAGVVKSLYSRIKKQESVVKSNEASIDGIIEGIGIAEEVMKMAEPTKEESVQKGERRYHNEDFAEMLASAIAARNESVKKSEPFDMRGEIGNVMKQIVHGGGKR